MTRAGGPALLALEDGSVFDGTGLGADGETFGEAVFNTGMAGYQEVLTDPSYAGQIVVMTAPHQGNYGLNDDDPESERFQVAGFAVREAARRPSSWRAHGTLHEALDAGGIVAIEGIDTRRLTLRLRERGAMRAAVSTVDLDPGSLVGRVCRSPGMVAADLARTVSVGEPYEAAELVGPAYADHGRPLRVAAIDLGMKRNILRQLAAHGMETTVYPATTPGEDILREGFDGAFLSNGPGDPAATRYGIAVAHDLVGRLPVFGICLGHQLMALAIGGRTEKMKFGHRGVNQPVKDLESGAIDITSHNHGFAVDPRAWGVEPPGPGGPPPVVATDAGRVALTHWNLNDRTLEGLRCLDVPAFAVQYHPEAAPGPHDAGSLFGRFRRLMEGQAGEGR